MDSWEELEYDSFMRGQTHDVLRSETTKRKLAVHEYRVPSPIHLEGGRLFWRRDRPQWKDVKPTVETFSEFVRLGSEDVEDVEILKYARRWGVLNLCKHLLPRSHNAECLALESYSQSKGEPISEWRKFARITGATLNISQDLTDGRLGDPQDWQILIQDDHLNRLQAHTLPALGVFGWKATRKSTERAIREGELEAKALIAGIVNRWLEFGNVRPRMEWQEAEPLVLLSGAAYSGGLFGAIAVHLLELAGQYIIASCSGCRKFYHPDIRPKSGQDRFCKTCRNAGVPVQLASHRRNLKISKEREQKRAQTARER